MRRASLVLLFASGILTAHPAAAEQTAVLLFAFASAPVSDAALGTIHGAGLEQRYRVRLVADDTQASAFRDTADIGQIMLDDWWAQDGASLIASNIVNGGK